MKQLVIIALCIIALSFCNTNRLSQQGDMAMGHEIAKDSSEQVLSHPRTEISFFGKLLFLGDSLYVTQQINEIAANNNKLSIKGHVLIIEKVSFGINIYDDGIILVSNTQVDNPKVMSIVKYFDGIYGEAREEEPSNYWWCADKPNNEICALTIRLRPLHSEEGGTTIMFY